MSNLTPKQKKLCRDFRVPQTQEGLDLILAEANAQIKAQTKAVLAKMK